MTISQLLINTRIYQRALDVSLKALNDTMVVDGLTPTSLVYGVHSKIPLPNSPLTEIPQYDRALQDFSTKLVHTIVLRYFRRRRV